THDEAPVPKALRHSKRPDVRLRHSYRRRLCYGRIAECQAACHEWANDQYGPKAHTVPPSYSPGAYAICLLAVNRNAQVLILLIRGRPSTIARFKLHHAKSR